MVLCAAPGCLRKTYGHAKMAIVGAASERTSLMKSLLIAAFAMAGTSVAAQDRTLGVTIGVGAQSKPTYFGSDTVETGVTGSFGLDRLTFGALDIGGAQDPNGFGFKGGFRYIGERSADDDTALAGLADVDAALELGGGVAYKYLPDGTSQNWGNYAFAEVRSGVLGHESVVAEVGADLFYAPNANLDFRAGPRLFGAAGEYAGRYFGVTDEEAAASSFDAFDATGGLLSRGVEASVSYDFNSDWGVVGSVTYEEFLDDAADSPIVQQGSTDQVSLSVVVTRALEFNF